ncbi:MAG: acyl--CoA ligase [Alphaproteobacteria bacterium]|jgi:acyl-CoA synthetase (AMP-forming)/AMP-acid ligase II|nr:acyl--CoA ligase [Alphaproteobacteria bacterium]
MVPFDAATVAAYRAQGLWRDQTLHDVFAANAAANPGRLALVDAPNRAAFAHGEPRRFDYAGLAALVDRLAAVLLGQGLARDDVMLVQMPNIHELIVLYLAAARLGVVVSPVPVQYRHGELGQIVETLRPKAFCTTARFAGLFLDHVPFSGRVLVFGPGAPTGAVCLDEATGDPVLLDAAPRPGADDIVTICWTSGTEGRPKGVPKTHNNWMSSGRGLPRAARLQPGDVILVPFPVINAASIGGLFTPWLGTGGTLVLHHPFDIDVYLGQIRDEGVHYTIAAPALLTAILQKGGDGGRLGRLRVLGTGSAPPDPWMMRRFEERFGIPVINFFGSNEGILLCADADMIPDPETRARLFPRVGDDSWPGHGETVNGGAIRLVDAETGERVTTPGRVAEMRINGPSLLPGYYRPDGFERSGFDDDGFFRTGDLFEITADGGHIRFVGRSKDLIVRGGMKIAPAELDALLSSHPKMREAAVASFADERLGERVCAFVVPKAGEQVTLDDLCAFLEEKGLARFKWPEKLVVMEALPRNALAKLVRSQLRA